MSYAPVVMFVYNRADHFKKTVEALAKCKEAKESELFIFSDAPKDNKAKADVEKVRNLAHNIENSDMFLSVTVKESEKNKGLANSVISGVSDVIEKYGKAIVVEDDCVASQYFLSFMNDCLDRFKDDKRIGSVAGYAPPIEFPKEYTSDIFTAYRSCSWGWATWEDRWQNVDWNLTSINELYNSKRLLKMLNSNGTDRFIRLYRQTKANKNSWSVKFGYHLVKNNMLTVYPRYSYIENIGCDGTGVHSKSGDYKTVNSDLSKSIKSPHIEFVLPDKKIQKTMKKFYSGGLISNVKRTIATKAIIIRGKNNLR